MHGQREQQRRSFEDRQCGKLSAHGKLRRLRLALEIPATETPDSSALTFPSIMPPFPRALARLGLNLIHQR
jgi:hypothetical protein